ncbi:MULTISPECIES: DNA-directed RNA polymerase subunit delta [Cohnella]|uniref:DNA-directed RNA polymerase subunit delta n=1 Tax=Cohnella TaxID=329857 RepID=UPI0009BA67EB|nr:DNA-directed RNA polymerase subunit delta [Cohnella massiliensis]MBN2981443.1 DNA-directed RNA polymerase subunit delta [Cohnella algarum]
MSAEYVLKLNEEKIRELPMVDLAFEVLKAANTPFYYRDLMNEIAKLRGFTEEQINDLIVHVYTEINIDGRFACVGNNVWGLKRWYPVEKADEAVTGSGKRPRIINDDDDLDDEDLYGEDEEEVVAADDENYDLFDEEREEIFDEGEEAAEIDEEVEIEEEEDPELEGELEEEAEEELDDDDLDPDDEDERD